MDLDNALVTLLAELRQTIATKDDQIAALTADNADLRRHLDECPANQEEPDARH